jgi:hypothetical protein
MMVIQLQNFQTIKIMGKTYKIGSESREQQIKSERNTRRQTDIYLDIDNFKHKVHKNIKDYNRQESKHIEW